MRSPHQTVLRKLRPQPHLESWRGYKHSWLHPCILFNRSKVGTPKELSYRCLAARLSLRLARESSLSQPGRNLRSSFTRESDRKPPSDLTNCCIVGFICAYLLISVNSQVCKGTVFKFDITLSTVEPVDINSQQPTSRALAPEPSQQNRLSSADVLTPAALAALPPDLVANLHQAILALDIERIETCITQIRELNASLAGAIAVLAKGYKYKQLLAFMQPATD